MTGGRVEGYRPKPDIDLRRAQIPRVGPGVAVMPGAFSRGGLKLWPLDPRHMAAQAFKQRVFWKRRRKGDRNGEGAFAVPVQGGPGEG